MGRTTIEVHRWKDGTPRAHIFICQYLVCIQFHILLALHSHRISLSLSLTRVLSQFCVSFKRETYCSVTSSLSRASSRLVSAISFPTRRFAANIPAYDICFCFSTLSTKHTTYPTTYTRPRPQARALNFFAFSSPFRRHFRVQFSSRIAGF